MDNIALLIFVIICVGASLGFLLWACFAAIWLAFVGINRTVDWIKDDEQ